MSFKSLHLPYPLLNALERMDYKKPYPIQEQAIPEILRHKDVLGIAKTGSGKTASYVLPILMQLQRKHVFNNRHVDALVLVPTRELAQQVAEVFKSFSQDLPQRIKTLAVFGGVSINPQMIAMQHVNILVATPGRLIELVESKAVRLTEIDTLVLDEADKILNMGFQKEMDQIMKLLPRRRQNLLFSATLSEEVSKIQSLLLHNPVVIKIGKQKTKEENAEELDLINQLAYQVEEERKGPLLRYLIKSGELKQVLVFTSSVYKADNVADKLRKNGIDAAAMHSRKSQGARQDALSKFKAGSLRVLVGTDLLSRGLDIEFLPCVINYELPRSPKDYIHRIGRTGRAENPGEAISLVSEEEEHHFSVIQKKMKKQVEIKDSKDLNLHGF